MDLIETILAVAFGWYLFQKVVSILTGTPT